MTDTERIITLRQRCLDRKRDGVPERYHPIIDAESLKTTTDLPWQIRVGRRTASRLSNAEFEIDELEIFGGRLKRRIRKRKSKKYKEAEKYLEQFPPSGGQTGHCEVNFSDVFSMGIDGLLRNIEKRLTNAKNDRRDSYISFIDTLNGFSVFIQKAARCAEKARRKATASRQKELDEIIDSCRRIAHQPPESFRDVIQLHWFICMGAMYADHIGYTVPGHLDRTLYPFYKRDMEKGAISKDRALLLIESLYLQINDYTADGGAVSAMVGGRDAAGNDVTNELSYLCLEALRRTNLVYPTVGVCWHEGTPQDLTDLAVELISKGYATPAFFGDETIQKGLQAYGVPPEESCNYINSTCVEITPVASSNVWVASPYFSTCKILLDEIDEQVVNNLEATTFDEFLTRYFSRLGIEIKKAADFQNDLRERRRLYGRKPLQSIFTKDCLEQGKDIDDGGARYNWVECSFVGLANLADSLFVIQEEIFGEKQLSLPKLKKMLDADFIGYERERLHLLSGYPKYGNNHAEVDILVEKTVELARKECAKCRILPDNAHFIPGAFCWVMHERLGSECGATPDGRKAGFPFADGGGPAQGREKNGPTAAILSTTSWEHSCLIGGLAYNMKFNRSLFTGPESLNRLRDLIITFLKRGGFETQINVVDHETLKRARENPEDYRDLVVRIGGYTDYFTRLSTEMQDEVMLRTEFAEI